MASFFLLRSSFFRITRPLASSEATAYYRPAPGRTDGIPERDQRPCDNEYKSVFTNSWLVRQRHRSWIKGLGKNHKKSELVHCLQCLLSGATQPWPQGLRETMVCIHVNRFPGKTHKNWNACIDAHRSAVPTKIYGFIRHPMRTG